MSERELEPCPFCGNSAILHSRVYPDERNIFYVQCNTFKPGWCGAMVSEKPEGGGLFFTADEAAAAWNRRSPSRQSILEEAAKAIRWANERLPGIEVPAMNGDNLAVTLCSHFCDGEDSEDDHGWSPAAIEGEEQTIEAIRKHYLEAIRSLSQAPDKEGEAG